MYLLHGKLRAKKGHANQLADILLEASSLVATAKGCKLYAISKDHSDPNSVFVTEIWVTKNDHENSMGLPGVKELIMKAMPILEGQPQKGQELDLIGGAGLD